MQKKKVVIESNLDLKKNKIKSEKEIKEKPSIAELETKIPSKKELTKKEEKPIKTLNEETKKELETTESKTEKDKSIKEIKTEEKTNEFNEPKKPVKKLNQLERIPSGIFGFDELIEGGIEKNSTVLVAGSAGTGKTTFGLQFLYYGAVKYNEPGILISFEESKESYYRHNAEYGWDFEDLEKKGLFRVLEYKPHQVGRLLDQGGGPIRDAINQMGAKRLVIDSITSYSLLFRDEYQQRENILKFFELLRKWNCTSIIISEMSPKEAETAKGSVGFLVDAVISLYYEKKEEKDVRVHSLEILKMRGTKHTNKVCALNFEKEGIKIYADIEIF